MSLSELDIWLDIGTEGRCFTYVDGLGLGAELGDLVQVHLRGRPMHGIVVEKRLPEKRVTKCLSESKGIEFSNIDELLQPAAVNAQWRQWLEVVAKRYHISPFKMVKAALPPGWLTSRKPRMYNQATYWWVSLINKTEANNYSSRQSELISYLNSQGGGIWQKDLYSIGFSNSLIQGLIVRGGAKRTKKSLSSSYFEDDYLNSKSNLELEKPQALTHEQKLAIDVFMAQPSGSAFLLWGVTGSGKTEVYLQIIAKELEQGRNCLVLAPEIGLMPQLVDRCLKRFGSKVYEYHSGLSEKERVKTWRKTLNTTQPVVVVGTRSAIFLPLNPLGVIVLDEEHDASYKQDSPMPCYHAKDLALDRARETGAKVVLGSATPSLSTWKSIQPHGDIGIARLTRRISNQKLPDVHVIDMRKELAEGSRNLISRSVMRRLAILPELGQQAVLLVPRRGFSSFLSCRSCGDVVQCPNCDVALTVHKGLSSNFFLRCHWCDYRKPLEKQCQQCGSSAFKPFGAGTQKVLEHLSQELKDLRLLRFDRDTTRGKDGHRQILERFAAGEADVLIGTQMLAKGMDLPRVTLAIVLAADALLHRPDLQAGEQSLQLFLQLAGRAGRGEQPGHVFVQTYCPEHPVIKHLVDGRYEEFLKKESKIRKDAGLVPYSRACLLRLSGDSNSLTATTAAALAEQVKPLCELKGWSLLGPAPAMIAKVAGKSRWQLLLHGPENTELPLPPVGELWKALPKGVSLAVDPDPMQL